MEIIKHGKTKTCETPHEMVCSDCECVFTYVEKEINQLLEFWGGITYTYINCPECGKTIIIKDFRK